MGDTEGLLCPGGLHKALLCITRRPTLLDPQINTNFSFSSMVTNPSTDRGLSQGNKIKLKVKRDRDRDWETQKKNQIHCEVSKLSIFEAVQVNS